MQKIFGLYPVITEEFCNGRSSVEVLTEVVKAGVKIVQLREKNKSKKELLDTAKIFRKITLENNVLFIINDDINLALETGADGVHLGQEDISCGEAKKISSNLIVGVSTHNLLEIEKALSGGADYINIGPVFATSTKKDLSYEPVGIDFLKKVVDKISVPFSVMGGIKKENITDLLEAGIKNIALITEITQAENIYHRTKELVEMINPYLI